MKGAACRALDAMPFSRAGIPAITCWRQGCIAVATAITHARGDSNSHTIAVTLQLDDNLPVGGPGFGSANSGTGIWRLSIRCHRIHFT